MKQERNTDLIVWATQRQALISKQFYYHCRGLDCRVWLTCDMDVSFLYEDGGNIGRRLNKNCVTGYSNFLFWCGSWLLRSLTQFWRLDWTLCEYHGEEQEHQWYHDDDHESRWWYLETSPGHDTSSRVSNTIHTCHVSRADQNDFHISTVFSLCCNILKIKIFTSFEGNSISSNDTMKMKKTVFLINIMN